MAGNSDMKSARCFEWTTLLPCLNCSRDSPAFFFQGCGLRLQLTVDQTQLYNIRLKRESGSTAGRPFDYTLYVEQRDFGAIRPIFQARQTEARLVSFSMLDFSDTDILTAAPDFRPNDTVTIVFVVRGDVGSTLRLTSETGEKSVQVDTFLMPNLDSLSTDLGEFLDSAAHPDVKVKCDGGVIHAHRAILFARSKVFSTMFRARMEESQSGEVDISDVGIATMRLFMKFVYSGKIPDLPMEMVPCLYALGDRYEVLSLKKMCSDLMVSNVSEENYTSYLALADQHSDQSFKNSVIDYITDRIQLMQNDSWLKFAAEHTKMAIGVYQKYVDKSGQK